jgi:glycine/D-amino acid oxidase-like deaminating enzyme
MRENKSPWIETLQRSRKPKRLKGALKADVLIIGGGIAGASTLYYLMEETDKTVVLVDANLVGHGATGYNAGHVVAGFEEAASVRIERFGLEKSLAAERMMQKGWQMFDEMKRRAGVEGEDSFLAYGAYADIHLITTNIETYCHHYDLAGVPYEQFIVAEGTGTYEKIPDNLKKYCKLAPHDEVLELLETKDTRYVAAMPHPTALINSAQLSEGIISYCLKRYSGRCQIYEHSPVHEILAGKDDVRSMGKGFIVRSERAVLCTNGFSHFKIVNTAGPEINTALHHSVKGFIDYIAGYKGEKGPTPASHWYHEPEAPRAIDAESEEGVYFYISRRRWDLKGPLLTIGGPERNIGYHASYNRNELISDDVMKEFSRFRKDVVGFEERKPDYHWHGLMGYTPSGVRLIGEEPKNRRLLYNLGCNGIGILPSIVGGRKIARHVKGETVEETIFDPQ